MTCLQSQPCPETAFRSKFIEGTYKQLHRFQTLHIEYSILCRFVYFSPSQWLMNFAKPHSRSKVGYLFHFFIALSVHFKSSDNYVKWFVVYLPVWTVLLSQKYKNQYPE